MRLAHLGALGWTLAMLAACQASAPARDIVLPLIWDVARARAIDEPELVARIAPVRYRLLGEMHDNPEHHVIRARLLREIARGGRHPAVVFEQFDIDNDADLAAAQRERIDAEGLATAGKLDRRAWEWPLHRPLLAAALEAQLPVRAGNASHTVLGPVLRRGDATAIDPRWTTRMEHGRWSDAQARIMDDEIVESHCGKLPATLVPRLVLAQRIRDAALAQAMTDDETPDGVILVAGNGHARRDLGVPLYLAARSDADIVSVAFIEASPEESAAPRFPREAVADHPGFDYLWITPRIAREDPCARMPAPPARAQPG